VDYMGKGNKLVWGGNGSVWEKGGLGPGRMRPTKKDAVLGGIILVRQGGM